MKTITLDKAFEILNECAAVTFDLGGGPTVSFPHLAELEGDPDNQFLRLEQTDETGYIWEAIFTEEPNQWVKVDGSGMWLTDNEGDSMRITILEPFRLEALLGAI